MNPRRIKGVTGHVFRLPGGTEDNDLWADAGAPCDEVPTGYTRSYWQPAPDELAALNRGGYVDLYVWSFPPPPVSLSVTEFGDDAPEPGRALELANAILDAERETILGHPIMRLDPATVIELAELIAGRRP